MSATHSKIWCMSAVGATEEGLALQSVLPIAQSCSLSTRQRMMPLSIMLCVAHKVAHKVVDNDIVLCCIEMLLK